MKKAFVFDFDDTLATTNARVIVIVKSSRWGKGYIKRELTPAEFNTYQLENDEKFDFSQFRCSHLVEKGKPTALVQLAEDVYNEDHDVYILTARSSDVADAIEKFLRLNNIKAKQIICVGDNDDSSLIAENKRQALIKIMKSYDKTYFYDDNEKNIELAKEAGVKSYLV
jgi:FMN phosphatase YigB (HAD superfamily)